MCEYCASLPLYDKFESRIKEWEPGVVIVLQAGHDQESGQEDGATLMCRRKKGRNYGQENCAPPFSGGAPAFILVWLRACIGYGVNVHCYSVVGRGGSG